MEIVPILRSLRHHKTAVALTVLQVALTLAITCNALFIVHDRVQMIGRPTGMDIDDIFYVTTVGYAPDYDPGNAIRIYRDALRGLPGVVDASAVHQFPLSLGGWTRDFRSHADLKAQTVTAAVMHVDEHGLDTLGLRLIAGRDFTATDVRYAGSDAYRTPPIAIVTRAVADDLFPGEGALGKTVYSEDDLEPQIIVGIVERLQGFHPHWTGFERTVITPAVFTDMYSRFLVRTLPGERDRIVQEADQSLGGLHTGAFVRSVHSMASYRERTYEDDRAMAVMLSTVAALILAITALGIAGLTSFNVRRRTRQIGMRRALGARRGDILRYFMLETWLITAMGALLGSGLAVALNWWLVTLYDLPSLPWYCLPLGALGLGALNTLAALLPALKASAIPPSIATRNS
jgi:putative ABC transport system permease protein